MIRNVQPDEDWWSWCYTDDRLYQPGSGTEMDPQQMEEHVRR